MKSELKREALEFVGPSFEEMSENEMLNVDAEVTPTVSAVSVSVLKVTCSAITGVAFTFTIDRIFNHK